MDPGCGRGRSVVTLLGMDDVEAGRAARARAPRPGAPLPRRAGTGHRRPRHPIELGPDRPGLVRPVRRDLLGVTGPTPAQTRGGAWRRTTRGFYVPATVDGARPEQRILEASMVVPTGYGVTGWAALGWWTGNRWFAGGATSGALLPVPVVTSTMHVRAQPGVEVSQEGVHLADLVTHDGVPLTRACCALSFEVRRRTDRLADAVAWIDMACYTDVLSLAEIGSYAAGQRGWTGIPLIRTAVTLADENSWSPQETRIRLRWVLEAELPRPLCNTPVFDLAGRHLGTPDLLDPVAGVVAEYDGSDHLAGPKRLHDVRREDAFRDHGLEYVTTLAGDAHGPHGFVERLLRAYSRARAARARGETPRWSATPPSWWVPTHTVARRRQLDAAQRARLLRYRVA